VSSFRPWHAARLYHLDLETEAYALRDRDRSMSYQERQKYHNRPEDVEWAAAKNGCLFSLAGLECPPIRGGKDK
jgi:hypothetical protein